MINADKSRYPRPQFVRADWANLNGEWSFAFDGDDGGEALGWADAFPKAQKIKVPYTYETALSGIGKTEPCRVVWYSRGLKTEKPAKDKLVMLHFEGSDYVTKVWINGEFVGQNRGAYHRFSFDITGFLKKDENILTVKCEDELDARRPRGKQRWYDGKPQGCFYTQSTGIWKDVWLEYVDRAHLKSAKIMPMFDSYRVRFDFELSRAALGCELETQILYDGMPVAKLKSEVLRESFGICADLVSEADIWQVAEWTLENPKLYDIRFALYKDGRRVDEIESYFGFREVRASGNCILLNRVPLYQKLILAQGYWPEGGLTPPDPGAYKKDLELIKSLGYNGVRLHQKIEDERFLYWADKLGVIVWCEMPSAYEFSDDAMADMTCQWQKIVTQNYNHPSVFVWVPFNESWGIQRILTDKAQQSFTQGVYYLTKAYDQMRPIISNDGWEHTKSDIITLHNYEEKGDNIRRQYDDLTNKTLANANAAHSQKLAFAEGFHYAGQPVMVSEYGGIAFKTDNGDEWGYGNHVDSKTSFLERFKSVTTAVKALPDNCGYCYTQLTDIHQEINGLLKADRTPKIPPEKIKEINDMQP